MKRTTINEWCQNMEDEPMDKFAELRNVGWDGEVLVPAEDSEAAHTNAMLVRAMLNVWGARWTFDTYEVNRTGDAWQAWIELVAPWCKPHRQYHEEGSDECVEQENDEQAMEGIKAMHEERVWRLS
jgi:hypothetical protein